MNLSAESTELYCLCGSTATINISIEVDEEPDHYFGAATVPFAQRDTIRSEPRTVISLSCHRCGEIDAVGKRHVVAALNGEFQAKLEEQQRLHQERMELLEGRWGTFVDAELGQVVHRCHAGVARPGPKRSTPSGRTEVWNRRRRMGAAAPSGLVFRG